MILVRQLLIKLWLHEENRHALHLPSDKDDLSDNSARLDDNIVSSVVKADIDTKVLVQINACQRHPEQSQLGLYLCELQHNVQFCVAVIETAATTIRGL